MGCDSVRTFVRPKFSRDLKVFKTIIEGKPLPEVANEFGISARTAKKIFKKMERYHKTESLYHAIGSRFALKIGELGVHTLIDLKKFIDENHDWRGVLAKKCGFDVRTIAQIESFATENGITLKALSEADEIRIRGIVTDFAREMGMTEKEAYGMFAEVCKKGPGREE